MSNYNAKQKTNKIQTRKKKKTKRNKKIKIKKKRVKRSKAWDNQWVSRVILALALRAQIFFLGT